MQFTDSDIEKYLESYDGIEGLISEDEIENEFGDLDYTVYGMGNNLTDNPMLFFQMPKDAQFNLLKWVLGLNKIKSFSTRSTSYGIKHLYTARMKSNKDARPSDIGHYVNNGQFKGAMLIAGFKVEDKYTQNWVFNVSKRSLK